MISYSVLYTFAVDEEKIPNVPSVLWYPACLRLP